MSEKKEKNKRKKEEEVERRSPLIERSIDLLSLSRSRRASKEAPRSAALSLGARSVLLFSLSPSQKGPLNLLSPSPPPSHLPQQHRAEGARVGGGARSEHPEQAGAEGVGRRRLGGCELRLSGGARGVVRAHQHRDQLLEGGVLDGDARGLLRCGHRGVVEKRGSKERGDNRRKKAKATAQQSSGPRLLLLYALTPMRSCCCCWQRCDQRTDRGVPLSL